MAAFQSGFSLGSSLYQQALSNADRAAQRKREEEEFALRKQRLVMENEAARDAAGQRAALSQARQGIRDFREGINRPATNAALDAAFERDLAASDAGVLAENATRVNARAASDLAAAGLPDVAPEMAPAVVPAAAPAAARPSNMEVERALTVQQAPDRASPDYRQGMISRLADYALLAGDVGSMRQLEAEGRLLNEDTIFGKRVAEYKGTDEQIGAAAAYLNNQSRRITMGAPDKNGIVRVSVVKPDGTADFLKLGRGEQAKLYAAAGLMELNPVRALGIMGEVNKELAAAVAADNNLESALAQNANDAAGRTATITHQQNTDRRADAAANDAAEANRRKRKVDDEERADKKSKVDAAVALYKETNPNATPAQVEAVRTGVLSAVPTLDKDAPAQVKLASAALRAQVPGITNMAQALEWARQSVSKSQAEVRADLYKEFVKQPGMSAERAKTNTEAAMKFLYPEAAAPAPRPAPAPATPAAAGKPASAAALPPLKERVPGQTYDTPRGPAIWRGSGWELVNKPGS